jgi:hypothetical protein
MGDSFSIKVLAKPTNVTTQATKKFPLTTIPAINNTESGNKFIQEIRNRKKMQLDKDREDFKKYSFAPKKINVPAKIVEEKNASMAAARVKAKEMSERVRVSRAQPIKTLRQKKTVKKTISSVDVFSNLQSVMSEPLNFGELNIDI